MSVHIVVFVPLDSPADTPRDVFQHLHFGYSAFNGDF